MLRRALCCMLCLLLAAAPAAMAEGAFTMAGYAGGKQHARLEHQRVFSVRMQERTGLTFTFDQYTSLEKWEAAKEAMFAPGGELPDVLFKAALTTAGD